MTGNKTPELGTRQAADPSHEPNTTELSLEDLSKASGGFQNCCTGAHYSSVIISLRKAGGDTQSGGG